ncbi:MAG: hypothetical protein MJE68_02095, partial [Proteobacteria bacterium]|nr:hypothetical protein [Pseudomonadota bacterium]
FFFYYNALFRVPVTSLSSSLINTPQLGLVHPAAVGGLKGPGKEMAPKAMPSIATLTSGLMQHSTSQQDSDDDYDE